MSNFLLQDNNDEIEAAQLDGEELTSSNKNKNNKNIDKSSERRSWEAWTEKENHVFFDSLVRNSRNWSEIAKDIGTKRHEQVRTYYYRVLRKIGRLLQSVQYTFDNRDRINTLIAMISFWEAKCETKFEENTLEFAEAIKERIHRQKKALENVRAKRLPTPEKVIVQLVPRNEDVARLISEAGYNPKLQLTLKSKKPIASVVDHISKKWIDQNTQQSIAPFPIRIYPINKPQHRGWGVEDTETTILNLFHSLGCPQACKLDYCWPESVPPMGLNFTEFAGDDFEMGGDMQNFVQQQPQNPQQVVQNMNVVSITNSGTTFDQSNQSLLNNNNNRSTPQMMMIKQQHPQQTSSSSSSVVKFNHSQQQQQQPTTVVPMVVVGGDAPDPQEEEEEDTNNTTVDMLLNSSNQQIPPPVQSQQNQQEPSSSSEELAVDPDSDTSITTSPSNLMTSVQEQDVGVVVGSSDNVGGDINLNNEEDVVVVSSDDVFGYNSSVVASVVDDLQSSSYAYGFLDSNNSNMEAPSTFADTIPPTTSSSQSLSSALRSSSSSSSSYKSVPQSPVVNVTGPALLPVQQHVMYRTSLEDEDLRQKHHNNVYVTPAHASIHHQNYNSSSNGGVAAVYHHHHHHHHTNHVSVMPSYNNHQHVMNGTANHYNNSNNNYNIGNHHHHHQPPQMVHVHHQVQPTFAATTTLNGAVNRKRKVDVANVTPTNILASDYLPYGVVQQHQLASRSSVSSKRMKGGEYIGDI